MKKALVAFLTVALVLIGATVAFADDITPNEYDLSSADFTYYEQGAAVDYGSGDIVYQGYDYDSDGDIESTHPYGTWNSPYTYGIDGYNYNDPQDYADLANYSKQVGVGEQVQFPVAPGFETALADMGFDVKDSGLGYYYVETTLTARFESGPHGGYLTSTHKCRECHAVHRAAGKFKLTRSDTRYGACDWCHGTGAGSGYNIQMDNDDNHSIEYNVGHSMGFGISNGKWKAPDDTYPAYTPNYWLGGFSCFDCHSPHANPQKLMGFDQDGKPIPSIVNLATGEVYNLGNPGHDMYTAESSKFFAQQGYWVPGLGGPLPKPKPYYLAGSWLLVKNPDKEIATTTETVNVASIKDMGRDASGNFTTELVDDNNTIPGEIKPGEEIPDYVIAKLNEFTGNADYPVNKVPTDWNNPIGSASLWDFTFTFDRDGNPANGIQPWVPTDWTGWTNYNDGDSDDDGVINQDEPVDTMGYNVRNPLCRSLILDEFCTDCHDGNAGYHNQAVPMFSEDRALRNQTSTGDNSGNEITGNTTNWKGQYDIGYGHDVNSRH